MRAGLSRLWHTLRHLRTGQLLYWVWRRGVQPRFGFKPPGVGHVLPYAHGVSFCFLNQPHQFATGELDWQPTGHSRLWVYNLHYFNCLRDPARSADENAALIRHWIAANPVGFGPGWEPYPLSLRLVNWCLWSLRQPGDVPQELLDSAAGQAFWLMSHLEKHILANHYFENLKALVFAGAVLPHCDAGQWLHSGQTGLRSELREQFLDDGGHYERSPSYHCLLLDGLLDLLELERLRPGVLDHELVESIGLCARRALELLATIGLPGDRYPLFNDSAFDSAPRPSQLYARAKGLGLGWRTVSLGESIVCLPAFGVFGWRDPQAGDLRIKCGAVGPDYQPGHTHCDMLSFEWYLDGDPVIVDTGVYEYEPGPMRHYVRSTAAHNTVSVGEAEQSEIWGEFRVARRAKVMAADMATTEAGARFEGEIRGFPGIRGGIVHRRVIERTSDARVCTVTVEDRVQGRGRHMLASRLLFHPDIEVEANSDGAWSVKRGEMLLARLRLPADCSIEWQSAPYCPEFGVRRDARQLVMRREAALPASISYIFELEALFS